MRFRSGADTVASTIHRFDIQPYSIEPAVHEREHTRCSNLVSPFFIRTEKSRQRKEPWFVRNATISYLFIAAQIKRPLNV